MKAFLGEPVGTFIVRTRTEAAARLLRYSDMPIADIAYRIGYSSPSSLSKVFKQFYGISPLEYRNNKNFVIMKPAIIRPELELKHEIKEVPARNVIYIRLFGDYKLNDYCSAWMRLCQFIQEEKLPMGEGKANEDKRGFNSGLTAVIVGAVCSIACVAVRYIFF